MCVPSSTVLKQYIKLGRNEILTILNVLNKEHAISHFSSVQFSSLAQLCLNVWDPTDCSTPGLPVHHQLLEFTQTHVHRIGDAIQPSPPLSSPSPPALNLSQHQGLFQWVSSSHQGAKVLEFQLQHQSFQSIFRTDFLRMDGLDLPAVQGTLKSLLQHHSSKASILWHSALFIPGEGNGNPLQYSCLENSMDGGPWWATVHGVTKSRTRLGNFTTSQLSLYSNSHIHTWLLEKP